jgi:hypothetical protein
LPKLQEISVFVPANMEIGIYGNYYHAATGQIIKMLEDGTVNVVRLLYYDLVDVDHISRRCIYAGVSITPRSCVGRSTQYGAARYRVDIERNTSDLHAITIARLTRWGIGDRDTA